MKDERQEEIIEEFAYIDNWMDKYAMLIDMGSQQPPLEAKYKIESNLIEGCQSRVWLIAEYHDNIIDFKSESDAMIVNGIAALLIRVLSGRSPKEIIDTDLYFLEKIGLNEHLSPTRSNGLASMVRQMKMYALAYQNKEKENI